MTEASPAGTDAGTTEGEGGATPDPQLGDPGKAAIAAERKRANDAEKAHRALAAELQALKDKDADATEVANRKAAEAEARAAQAERALMLRTVADKVGIPAALVSRLQGDTEADLEADARELLKLLPKDDKSGGDPRTPPPGKPRERLKPSGGGDPTGGDALPLNGDPIVAALNAKLGIR